MNNVLYALLGLVGFTAGGFGIAFVFLFACMMGNPEYDGFNALLILVGGTFIGFLVGCVCAYELLRQAIRSW